MPTYLVLHILLGLFMGRGDGEGCNPPPPPPPPPPVCFACQRLMLNIHW